MNVKKLMVVLSLAMVLTALSAGAVFAETHPVVDCPDSFHPHKLSEHQQHSGHDTPQHKHVGNDEDLNGDGWICGKHVGKNGSVHVHIDNNVPVDTLPE